MSKVVPVPRPSFFFWPGPGPKIFFYRDQNFFSLGPAPKFFLNRTRTKMFFLDRDRNQNIFDWNRQPKFVSEGTGTKTLNFFRRDRDRDQKWLVPLMFIQIPSAFFISRRNVSQYLINLLIVHLLHHKNVQVIE